MSDSQYLNLPYKLNQREHRYGDNVFLLSNPLLISQMARLCNAKCRQPEVNDLFKRIYRSFGQELLNYFMPRTMVETPTRMIEKHPEGVYHGQILDDKTPIVIASLARAGILPSLEMFDLFSSTINPDRVRIDHVMISRQEQQGQGVTGANISDSKIGGSIDQAMVFIPDPMGATGSSVNEVISMYKNSVEGSPKAIISMNMIVTPEFVSNVHAKHPDALIASIRLDRGFSSARALSSVPGTYKEEEKGLNADDYIVPGGGGFGELSTNAWV